MKSGSSLPGLQTSLVKSCSGVTIVIYLLIALLLVITAVAGAIDTVRLLAVTFQTPNTETLTAVLQSILFLIIIATLIDMVRSYVKVGRVLLRPIFIAGITTMVRRLLVGTPIEFMDLIGVTLVIVGLSVCLIFITREERKNAALAAGIQKAADEKEDEE